ncbi:MAG: carbon-nitrogen family hydrolase [Verrucomicrobia bacterium]|nr:carbon-nitrogen family hydrolase [Verrucomicrobiota bacterium]
MNALLCQTNIVWEDQEANFSRILELIGSQETPQGSLVVLPEMFSTGFSMHVDKVAEGDPSLVEAFLEDLAQKHESAVIGGLVSRVDGEEKGRNELLALNAEGVQLARYQKIRTFRYTNEFEHYQRGTEVMTFEWGGFKICPLICYDLRFPELFRRGAALGAQMFVVIASWPAVRVDHWLALLRARAIENQAYVIGVNRCGEDPNWAYPGASVVIDPHGKVIADAGKDEAIISVELSVDVVEDWRNEFPALVDLETS